MVDWPEIGGYKHASHHDREAGHEVSVCRITSRLRRRTLLPKIAPPSCRNLFLAVLFIVPILPWNAASGKDSCEDPIPCHETFKMRDNCLVIDGARYIYKLHVTCPAQETDPAMMKLVEQRTIRGEIVTTAPILSSLLRLGRGRHCNQRPFEVQNLRLEFSFKGNLGNPILTKGTLAPIWCFDFDGKRITFNSIKLNYVVNEAPPMIRLTLENKEVKKKVNEIASNFLKDSYLDVPELLDKMKR